MADQDIMHTTEIMKAALPFIDAHNRVMAEFFLKIFDMMGSLKTFTNPKSITAHGFEAGKIDLEGMLNGIRPVCNIKERGIIDQILNMFRMKRMFEMYNNMMEMMKNMPDFGGFDFGGNTDDAENVTGNFSGMNFESIFNNLGGGGFSSETQTETEATNKSSDPPGDTSSFSEQDKGPSFNPQGMMNNKMFDMFKTMVPPEQMSTFENLSMLLKTMSYDNNSKPDDRKDCNDG